MIKPIVKNLTILLIVGAGIGILFNEGIIDIDFKNLYREMTGQPILAKYYQWNDNKGKVVISKTPPKSGISFVTFESDNLSLDNEVTAMANPKLTPSELEEQKRLEKANQVRITRLKEQLVKLEVSTQCRWLIEKMIDLHDDLGNDSKRNFKQDICYDLKKSLNLFKQHQCKNSTARFDISEC